MTTMLTRKGGKVSKNTADHRKVASLKGVKPNEFFGVVAGATGQCACVVCGQPLSDSLSVERMIGPKCFGDNYKEAPPLDEEGFAKVMGMVAALDSRVNDSDGAIDKDVIDFIIAHPSDSRAVANILVAWGSVNALKGARAKVLAITPILRELGYPKLADRLEKDRTPFHLFVEGETVYLRAPYASARELQTKLPWVGVTPTQCEEKGRKKYLMVQKSDKVVLWAVLKHRFQGQPLSIEGKGIITIPAVTDKERALLNARDVRGPVAAPVAPVATPGEVKVTKVGNRLMLTTPPPWESPEASTFVEGIKAIAGRKWHPAQKQWSVPVFGQGNVEDAADAVGFVVSWQ